MHILGTGLSGLVGSRIIDLLSDSFTFENLSLETGVDITKKETVESYFSRSDASWVFHFAAYTNVQQAEQDKSLGEKSLAWQINVSATETIVDCCRRTRKNLVYVDTDYAFDGRKKTYSEDDVPNPLSWYGRTKSEGAFRVLSLGISGLVIRIANPYRAFPVGKKDFVHKMVDRLKDNQDITGATDQVFTPTFVDDIAYALRKLVDSSASGIYHVVGSHPLTPFEAACDVAEVFGYDKKRVKPVGFREMFRDRAQVPQYAALSNTKISSLGILMHSFREGLQIVKEQELQEKKQLNVVI